MSKAVLSFSGGLDSTTCLLYLIKENYEPNLLTFMYGQKHDYEIKAAREIVNFLQNKGYHINHKIVDISSLQDLLQSSLTTSAIDTPKGHYSDPKMKLTVVPNRNKIFNSIIQAYALSVSDGKDTVHVVSGITGGSEATYPDTTPEFTQQDWLAFKLGNWGTEYIHGLFPLNLLNKKEIIQLGISCCETLNIDFDELYKLTYTSYIPVELNNKIYSDPSNSASIKRIEAFSSLNLKDPIEYSDGNKVLSWIEVMSYNIKNII